MDPMEIKQEALFTKHLFRKATAHGLPLSGTFELSPVCNFSCPMCYVRRTPADVRASARPILTNKDWLKTALEAREAGTLYLLLTGGEPFLVPGFRELYCELIKLGFILTVNTNGSMIDETCAEWLAKLPPVRLNITMYGASDETYNNMCRAKDGFAKFDKAVNLLKKAGVPVKLNCSLTPVNAGDLETMINYAAERELIIEVNTYMFPPVRRDAADTAEYRRFTPAEAAGYHLERYRLQYGEERYKIFLGELIDGICGLPAPDEYCTDPVDGKLSCRAGRAAYWITWDGLMTPCGMMCEPAVDIRRQSFAAAWEKLKAETESLRLSGVCKRCKNHGICHSCAAMAAAETGDFGGVPAYLCEMTAEMKRLAAEALSE